MAAITQKCATTVSILALASLPGDRGLFQPTPSHPDFKSGTGYVKRTINGEACHGVDWDGTTGVDSVFREKGPRSGRIWREFREWNTAEGRGDLARSGNKACELLLKHFGPYHPETSDALQGQRKLEDERRQVEAKLDAQFPATVRRAAHEYLGPHLSLAVRLPPFAPTLGISTLALPEGSTIQAAIPSPEYVGGGSFTQSEIVLRNFMLASRVLTAMESVEDFAKEVVEKADPIESQLQMLEVRSSLLRLPPIPGEGQPADMDHIYFGAMICRHRAIVVGILLADAGFDVEVVRGTVERDGHSGRHLFVFAPDGGILEPSADGPDFWRDAVTATEDNGKLSIKVKSGAVYRFEHRVPLKATTPL